MNTNADKVFNQLQRNFNSAMKTLPTVVANEMVNFTKERFTEQNWLDNVRLPWKKRKGNRDKGRAILTKTATLKRAPRPVTKGDMAGVAIAVPYAEAHNKGVNKVVSVKSFTRNTYSHTKSGTGKLNKSGTERMQTITSISGSGQVKAHTRHMRLPRRQFVGASVNMVERLKRVSLKHVYKFVS